MTSLTIQIREEEKSFSKFHLAEVLNVSPSTISKWIKIGKLPSPSGLNAKFTRKDVETIFKILNYTPIIKLKNKYLKDWTDLRECSFLIHFEGIFRVSRISKITINDINDAIKKYGLWNAQGLINHEHMDYFIKNPILQTILIVKLIDCWIEELSKLHTQGKIIIYWNGSVDSTLCIYLVADENDKFLNDFDRHLRIKNCIITDILL